MKTRYITIEREYGSGGTAIARQLSKETGIPCYGREILENVAAKYNVSISDIENYEENVTGSFLYSLFALSKLGNTNTNMLTPEGNLFIEEQEAIKNLARKGSAIFLGHCASETLNNCDGLVRIFIRCSDYEQKKDRISKEYGIPEADIENIRKKFDKKRANYYHANTSQKWDDFRNYDIVLDSAKLGEDTCVKVLKACL